MSIVERMIKMLFNYTTPLRTFFENLPANADQSLPHPQVIENGRSSLFSFDYPLFDPNYKKVFETHFIRNFYMREIGFETFGLFKFQLESFLLINMPYWNKMFESELLQYDPLTNSKTDKSYNKKNEKTQSDTRDTTNSNTVLGNAENTSNRTANTNGTSTNTTSSDSNTVATNSKSENESETDDNFNRQLESNNPDSRLALTATDGEGVIEYASSIKENNENNVKVKSATGDSSASNNVVENSTNTQTSNLDATDTLQDNSSTNVTGNETKNDVLSSTINDIEDFIEHSVGKIGSQSFPGMVADYRNSLLRIEKMIFKEMNELFMLVY